MLRKGVLIFLILLSGINVMSKATASTSSGITLVDAFQIGLTEARKWDAQANLISITSVGDTGSTPPSTLGNDGKREVWNLLFGNGQRNEILFINIKKVRLRLCELYKKIFKTLKLFHKVISYLTHLIWYRLRLKTMLNQGRMG